MLIRGVVSSPVRGVVGSGFGGGPGPEGDAYFYADFRYPNQYYYLNGVAYQQFTDIPGATSVGGAGFGTVQRNGIWTPVPADAPLIGDGGLRNAEARTNLFLNSATPVTQNITLGATGLYTITCFEAGSVAVAAGTATITGAGTATPGAPVTVNCTATGTITCTVTGSPYCVNVSAGANINDPPIFTTGIPATRTGYSYRETGRAIAPVHYGVARARFVAPLANHATTFPRIWSLRPTSGPESLSWVGIKADGRASITAFGDGTSGAVAFADNPVPGIYQTVAWARREGTLAVSLGGAAPSSVAAPAPPPQPFTRVAYLEEASGPGASTANAEMDIFATWNGDISDAALQALSARFTA